MARMNNLSQAVDELIERLEREDSQCEIAEITWDVATLYGVDSDILSNALSQRLVGV